MSNTALIATILAVICGIWVVGMSTLCAARIARRKTRRKRFLQLAAERGFNGEEAQSMWLLGRFSYSEDRTDILTSCEVLDHCVTEAKKAAGDDLLAWPELLSASRISALRRKSRLRTTGRFSLADTRDVEVNQLVTVALSDRNEFKSFVLNVTRDGLRLSMPRDEEAHLHAVITSGLEVKVSFWRPRDGRYEFTTRVLDEDSDALLLAHSDMHRHQEREYVRVRHVKRVGFSLVDETTADKFAEVMENIDFTGVATLQDISASGAAFVCDTEIQEHSHLLLHLELPDKPWSLFIPAQVLRQTDLTGTSRRQFRTAVQFALPSRQVEHRLCKWIAALQQDLIRRLRSRTTTPEGAGEAWEPLAGITERASNGVEAKNV